MRTTISLLFVPCRSSHGLATALLLLAPMAAAVAAEQCEIRSGARRTPVIELYTSEGCSSCPPADQWLSTLKGKPVVAQAFHVAYWDYIGWKDRFAQTQFTARQKEIAQRNGLRGIYTPQLVRNGLDWRGAPRGMDDATPALAQIEMRGLPSTGMFEATVRPAAAHQEWTAYASVTEDGHVSRVLAGENAGEQLRHDFVVRQLTPLGRYKGPQSVRFAAIASQPGHLRRINLVVSDGAGGEPLQAVSMACP